MSGADGRRRERLEKSSRAGQKKGTYNPPMPPVDIPRGPDLYISNSVERPLHPVRAEEKSVKVSKCARKVGVVKAQRGAK